MPPEATDEIITDSNVSETDNSEVVENQTEPSQDDNSGNDNNQEPEQTAGEEVTEGKFTDLNVANKSYAELHKKLGEQSNEIGELRKAAAKANELEQQLAGLQLQEAQQRGFNTVEEYQYSKEIAKNTANEFAKYVNEVEFPTEMVNMLNEYKNNPSEELLEAIEAQFSVETIKKVAGANAIYKGQLEAQQTQALENEIKLSAKQYLDTNVKKYAEDFKNPAFAALYGEAFRAYGCDLDTDKFVELMRNYASSAVKIHGIQSGINKDNSDETDEIAGSSSMGGTGDTKSGNGKSLLTMSDKELDKRLAELI